ncbi:DUF1015 domain-containing protein [Panacibacter ginsenosidivorans]|uniref:DUF1015 domain-containing protein n=1 Tax=Panacibacter ginsenosidivorans TaxID=1813871 RepID=A0A5B8V9D7_9BACT|nr:DUF1015 family protein [Panacibacter ginsenosidivorans]QEC67859.1 DUF1015 domain-containing protein [Panacibacter ginsenosidivorans]
MSSIRPFKALRPQAQFTKQVASRPYDVLSSAEARIEAQGNPASFLHITKSEIDLPESTDIHSAEVYEKAKENLTAFLKRDILFRENKDCYYVYRLIMDGRSQTGLVCVSSIDDYENGIIKKHEFTRPEKEQDRINHIKTTGAQTGNVFLAYRNVEELDELIEKWMKTKTAVYNFTADDGIEHAVWIINDTAAIEKITAIFETQVPCTYIADGHHRAASAAKVRKALGKDATPEADYFLTTLFPASQLVIMDYNRVVKNLNGHSVESFLEALNQDFIVEESGRKAYKPQSLHEFGFYAAKKWYKLTAKEGTYTEDPIGVLDVTILQNNVLGKHLNIHDQRTDKNIDFVGGIRGLAELENRVNSGEMAAAFSLYPVSIEQLFSIADSGNVMPPKSTWFEPKLRDGLLTHLITE